MTDSLEGKSVAVFLAPMGTEEVEFTDPKEAVEDAGASVDVVGAETGDVETVNGDINPGGSYEVERTFSEVSVEDYDGLVVPGGCVGADQLRADDDAVGFVHDFFETEKPLCVICHGPWTLVEADVVVPVPARFRPEGKVIVAKQEALDLADYLLSLDRTYPAEKVELRDNGFVTKEGS